MRNLIATPLFLVLAWSERVAAVVAMVAVVEAAMAAGWGLLSAVPGWTAAIVAYWLTDSVRLPGRCRPLSHVCRELADRVADWAGWDSDLPATVPDSRTDLTWPGRMPASVPPDTAVSPLSMDRAPDAVRPGESDMSVHGQSMDIWDDEARTGKRFGR